MEQDKITNVNGNDNGRFLFRQLHPNIFLGTASDRYAGWLGQIYSREKYENRITRRIKKIKGGSFQEETLPVDSVSEYFSHFPVLEVDYTFYSLLRDQNGQPAKNFHVLQSYAQYIRKDDRLILKVPQMISAQKIRHGSSYIKNESYLNPDIFVKCFYEPATEILGKNLSGMIFEQEYQRKQDRKPILETAAELDGFLNSIPMDDRYHIELRTEAYLSSPVFDVLQKHGVGQVLSHWTWLPSLKQQFEKAGGRTFNSENQRIIRLLTPRGMRYEDAYAAAYPFNQLQAKIFHQAMVQETADLMHQAVKNNIELSVLVNNRAGGNAPLMAERIVQEFLGRS